MRTCLFLQGTVQTLTFGAALRQVLGGAPLAACRRRRRCRRRVLHPYSTALGRLEGLIREPDLSMFRMRHLRGLLRQLCIREL